MTTTGQRPLSTGATARLDPTLQWYQAPSAKWFDRRAIAVGPRGGEYLVNALGVLRAFFQTVRKDASALEFTRRYGPLVEPDGGTLPRAVIVKTQQTLVAAQQAWQAPDSQMFADLKRMYEQSQRELAEMGDSDAPLVAVTPDDFPAIAAHDTEQAKPVSRLTIAQEAGFHAALSARSLLAARQAYVAPILAQLPLRTRLEFDGTTLVMRPSDLLSAMALALASRIAVGDASIRCRRIRCTNLARRWLSDGNSMKTVYCSDACRKKVERYVQQDRYPQLRGLSKGEFVNAARKLRGDEVL